MPTPKAPPVVVGKIKHLAGLGLERPSALNAAQVRTLASAVMARIEPRKKG